MMGGRKERSIVPDGTRGIGMVFPALKRWAIVEGGKLNSAIRAIRVIRGRNQLLDAEQGIDHDLATESPSVGGHEENCQSELLVDGVALNCQFDFNH
jgi:hypothetical protein